MNRVVKSELLDTLPPDDPRAIDSRNDLHRINAWMRSATIMAETLEKYSSPPLPWHLTEIGAGDGSFLLSVAKQMSPCRPRVKVTLLDCQPVVAKQTLADFAALGWPAVVVTTDIFNWPLTAEPHGIVVANLFLHHFEDARLAKLLQLVAARAEVFVALEPRRACWPLFCSRLLWLIGCNVVTRHDAVASVRAGFSGREISSLWADNKNWQLTEKSAGLFSHLFIARKNP